MTSATADQLSIAVDITGQLIAATGEDQWAAPTPCPDWNVRDLVAHVVAGNSLFASALGVPLTVLSPDPNGWSYV